MRKQNKRNEDKNSVLLVLKRMSSKEKSLSLADLSYFTCL